MKVHFFFIFFFWGGEGRGFRWGRGRVGGGSGWMCAMLVVGGDVGYGGCEPRIEGIVQCT